MPQYIGSSTPILAGQSYTSRWVIADQMFNQISGSVFADQAGNLFVQQSGDAINADVSATYAITASTGTKYLETVVLPYVRLKFTNTAGSNQTVLRLFSRFVLSAMP